MTEKLIAENKRLRSALEDAVETLESMDLHIRNPLYERLRTILEAPDLSSPHPKADQQ